jgi:GAF domain-containing protein
VHSPDDSSPVTDPARLIALHEANLLDTAAEQEFDELTARAAALLRAPIALVSLVDTDRQFFKSAVGLPEPWSAARQTGLAMSVCKHVVRTGAPLAISDTREHEFVREQPKVADAQLIAYAGAPLTTADGHTVGSLCVIDSQRRAWTAEELAALSELAGAVVDLIERRRAAVQDPQPGGARAPAMPVDEVLAAADALWQPADELLVALAGYEALVQGRDQGTEPAEERERAARARVEAAQRALFDAADAFGRGAAASVHWLTAGLGPAARALWLGALYYAERVTVRRDAEARFAGGTGDLESLQRAAVVMRAAEAELERTAAAYRLARLDRRARTR